MTTSRPKFFIGQIIHHTLYDYRGVIIDVDPAFSESDQWYENVATSRPPKDEPWYRVLVDNASHQTYVAEQNIEISDSHERVNHPDINDHFSGLYSGRYITKDKMN